MSNPVKIKTMAKTDKELIEKAKDKKVGTCGKCWTFDCENCIINDD
jgi:hypothetical protein